MSAGHNYWLDLFTWSTWQQFLAAGAQVSSFRESRMRVVKTMKPGDYLLCYLTGISRWIGLLEVTSEGFRDEAPIWNEAEFPARVRVKPLVTLTPETAVPVLDMWDQLSVFQNVKNPNAWTGHFRGSPMKWSATDGQAVAAALFEAQRNPVTRDVDLTKLKRNSPALYRSKVGKVTIPEDDPQDDAPSDPTKVPGYEPAPSAEQIRHASEQHPQPSEPSAHTEMQWLLLRLGSDMGLDVWVARNDKSKQFNGKELSRIPRMKDRLPLQFDEVTNRTIELIDVLWLKGNSIIAAFEIESTTSIYSGLLRMSDLIAMQPNLKIPLFIVAPDDRRDKVLNEVNRPTFERLTPPLSEICRFIPFSELKARIAEIRPYLRYMKPEFLQEISYPCATEDI